MLLGQPRQMQNAVAVLTDLALVVVLGPDADQYIRLGLHHLETPRAAAFVKFAHTLHGALINKLLETGVGIERMEGERQWWTRAGHATTCTEARPEVQL